MKEPLGAYIKYCRSLTFDEKPDYAYLRRLFRRVMDAEKLEYDGVFDWTPDDKLPNPTTTQFRWIRSDFYTSLVMITSNIYSHVIFFIVVMYWFHLFTMYTFINHLFNFLITEFVLLLINMNNYHKKKHHVIFSTSPRSTPNS